MLVTFDSAVESFAQDDGEAAVTFSSRAGRYYVSRSRPRDVVTTLRAALYSGREVSVTVDPKTLEIADAIAR